MGDCSNCETVNDSNARTTRFYGLGFTNVDRRILWKWPFKGIFHDLDGTLTGQDLNSYVTADLPHNDWEECTKDIPVYDGIVCPEPFAVQKVIFHAAVGDIYQEDLYLWQYVEPTERRRMLEEVVDPYPVENASTIPWFEKANPDEHWSMPFVTNKKYYARWD